MEKVQTYCFRHKDRTTNRRCFICSKALCSDCQMIKSHHIFCSNLCWMKYHFRLLTKKINPVLQKSKVLFSPWSLVLFLLTLLIWVGSTMQNVQQKLTKIQQVMVAPAIEKNGSNKLKEIKIISPVKTKGMVYRNLITIEGEADNNSVVMLLKGNKLIQSVQPEDGKFEFKDIKLARGQNEYFVQMVTPDGGKIALEKFNFRYNSPTINHLSKSLNRGSVEFPYIAFTFDGGYLNNISDDILDYLKDLQIKATFFLTGHFVTSFPETVLRIVNEGHEIGNHTMTHPHFTTFETDRRHSTNISYEMFRQELSDMAEAYFELSGKKLSPIWRAPFGEHNFEIRSWAAELGYRQIGWTVEKNGENMDTRDWIADPSLKSYLTADQIKDKILTFGENSDPGTSGAIILMHFGSQRNDDFPHHKLPEIVEGLREKGYKFVTISEMIENTYF